MLLLPLFVLVFGDEPPTTGASADAAWAWTLVIKVETQQGSLYIQNICSRFIKFTFLFYNSLALQVGLMFGGEMFMFC